MKKVFNKVIVVMMAAIAELIKTYKIIVTGCVLLIAMITIPGCKKDNAKSPACRIIATSIPSLGIIINFSFNSNGKLNRISSSLVITTIDYPTDNTVVAITTDAGVFRDKKIITVNAAGLATNVRIENNAAGTEFTNDSFEYNGEELARSVGTASINSTPIITTFTWFNGNMITSTSGGAIIESRDYFTDKPRQIGDVFAFTQLTQGFETIRTKNLAKFTSQGQGLNFTYEFGADGNISSAKTTLSSGVSGFQDYQYECK